MDVPVAVALAAAAGALGVAVGVGIGRRRGSAEPNAGGTGSAPSRDETRDDELRSMAVALSAMREGVLLFGPDGTTIYTNPAIEEHLAVTPSSVDTLLPLGLRDAVRHAALAHLSSEVEVETGSPARWLRATATPVGDDDSVLLVVRDVTEARRLEATRRDFVANASHELKTPVASILAAAETIHDAAPDDPEVLQRFGAQLEADAIRLSRIVSDLLDLSRLEGGSDALREVDLSALVREGSARLQIRARDAGVELSIATEPVRVRGSERDLALLVDNLLDNAVRYTREGGRVDVELREGDEEGILVVADTGVGIPSRDLPRVFERFYRVDQARSRETGGTGLGLSIVKHVVENHGGSISVTSELGRGTRVEVRLPAALG